MLLLTKILQCFCFRVSFLLLLRQGAAAAAARNSSSGQIKSFVNPALADLQAFNAAAAVEIRNSTCGICGSSCLAGIGDTLASVAARCGVSVAEIAVANPGLKNLTSGAAINVPCTNKDGAHCGVCGNAYTVRKGDTLSAIAAGCGLDLQLLEKANRDIDFQNIFQGELIRVPCLDENARIALTGCGVCGIQYTASRDNESLVEVGKKCDARVGELLEANPGLQNSSTLIKGQKLQISCANGKNLGRSKSSSCGPCGNAVAAGYQEAIAAKCRVGFIELTRSNPGMSSSEDFRAAKIVRIPCSRADPYAKCSGHICETPFVVEKNNTGLADVARACNVTVSLISYANDLRGDQDQVFSLGQRLAIPCEEDPKPLRTCSICGSSVAPSVTVDLITVAKACGSTILGIREATNTSLTTVTVGDVLRIPCDGQTTAGCGPCGIAYRAADEDTLASIAVKCATMISDIRSSNPDMNFSELLAGKVISLPCLSSAGSSLSLIGSNLLLMMLLLLSL